MRGTVVTYASDGEADPECHESVTLREVARRLARLKGYGFAGPFDPARSYETPLYSVPDDTLTGKEATCLGAGCEDDFFGGAVASAYLATKAITHPLVAEKAAAPADWPADFADRVRGAVHAGFTVFDGEDAGRAAQVLLRAGPVRLKRVRARGGRGQEVVRDRAELERALEGICAGELRESGLVLEEHLEDVSTYSVGKLALDDLLVTYCGTQRLTRANDGATVYGGSSLLAVRGGFDALLELNLPAERRRAVEQAQVYDAAADACLPGFFASRRNYDIAAGTRADGSRRCGVLEQSWRVGGASGAEVAVLEAFRAAPQRGTVGASCFEVYGALDGLPPEAALYYRGEDRKAGPMVKYAMIDGAG